MKKNPQKSAKNILTLMILILLIMGTSFLLRFMVNHKVVTKLGDDYMDPDTGAPYLTEMDSYYHLRMTKDLKTYGHAGDTVKDGKLWDSMSYAPYGRSAEGYRPLMAYIAIYSHKLLSLFSDLTLEQVAYWQGAVISAFVVIPVFIFVYRLGGMLAAVTASLLSTINYGYFVHTVPGFYDTDTVISWTSCCLFCFGCLFIDSIVQNPGHEPDVKEKKRLLTKRIVYAALFLISLLLLIGSWYIYYMFAAIIAVAVMIYVLLRCLIVKGKEGKGVMKRLMPAIVFAAVTVALILIAEPGLIKGALRTVRGVFSSGSDDLFPNALISVSEMRTPSLIAGGLSGLFQMKVLSGSKIGIINAVGGIVPCLGAIAMCVLLIVRIVKKDIRFEYILLLIWFIITAVLAIRSWRFIMLFAVPVAILAGMLTGTLNDLMRDKKMMDYKIFSGMIAVLMLFPAVYGAYRSSEDAMPSVNRHMHDSLAYIKDKMPEDTIITGWWDYGYFFEEKACRRTIFDGGSQNGKRIYWIAKAFATDDELLSSNIFRMIAGSGDDATDKMLKSFGKDKETLALMNELLSMEKDSAKARLNEEDISPERSDELISLLFPENQEDIVCVITQGMPGMSKWFSRFGYQDGENGYTDESYSVIMNAKEFSGTNERTGWRLEHNGVEVDLVLERKDGVFRAGTSVADEYAKTRPFHVDRVLVKEGGHISGHESGDEGINDGAGCVVFIDLDGDVPRVSLMTSLLYDSVFGRLYYQGGEGLDDFSRLEEAPGSAILYNIEHRERL